MNMETKIQVYRVHENEFPFSMVKAEVCRDCANKALADGFEVDIDEYLSFVEPLGEDCFCEVCEGGFETDEDELSR